MISARQLEFSYNGDPVLQDLSFSIGNGEFVGIIGPNGAGKSTLLKLLNRILPPGRGEILLDDKKLSAYSRKALARLIGFVPQEFTTAFNFSVMDIVMMGRFPHQGVFGLENEADYRIASESMAATDCYSLRKRNFLTLSGGERQRVVLASALTQQPRILLLDEPTNALDLRHQIHFYRILRKLQQEKGMTILSVTHDVNLAAQFCRRILVIKSGRLIADGPVQEVLQQRILQPVYDTPIRVVPHPESGLPVILPGFQE